MWLIDADALEYESGTDPNDPYADMLYVRAEHIENAQAVETAPSHWIPCSERMPEEGQSVLAVVDGNVREAGYSYDAFSGSGFYRDAHEIEWWMPLPEPPKGGADK